MRSRHQLTCRLFAPPGLLIPAVAALLALGCTDDTTVSDTETDGSGECGLLAGDLVISEIVADVDGTDAGLEWFEIYNASGDTVDLEGLTLAYEKLDGSSHKEHVIARGLELGPGEYAVVGSIIDELAESAAHISYGYGGDLGEFSNQGGYLAVGCGDVIDEVLYDVPSDAASRVLDGSQAPDAVANDNLDSWCDSQTEFTPGFAATPLAANDVCGSADECMLDGEMIPIIHPAPGELIISEVLPDPDEYADGDAEWFELYSLAGADYHLNGLDIGKTVEDGVEETIAVAECIVLGPGEYALIAKSDDPMLNGELPTPDWLMSLSLKNDDGALWVGVDGEVLDAVQWPSTGAGKARTLDPGSLDPVANDDQGNWCDATAAFNDFNEGSPKAANELCPLPPPPEGQCYEDGELREITPLEPGDLEIVEFLANPECTDDGDGEWFELFAHASGDLNGLQIGKDADWKDTVEAVNGECIPVTAGDYVLFAHEPDAEINGGLPPVDVLFDMALNNSSSDLIIGFGADASMPDDQTSWGSLTAGAASSKDLNGVWCDAVDAFGCGDLGTPAEANPMCGGGPVEGCIDPDTMLMRMINSPAMGTLTLSEVMPNPSTAEPAGEWFELHASVAMDLNGLQLGKNQVVSHTVNDEFCIEVPADSYVVLARSDLNECALPAIDYVYDSLNLSNGANNNVEIGYEGAIWDSYQWPEATDNGTALSYDPINMSWCDAVAAFGCGDLATPGQANPECGGGGDGMCLDGMVMRATVPPVFGDLIITEFMANPAAVTDTNGEWLEVLALTGFDLNGVTLGQEFIDGSDHTIAADECLALAPGEYALLARNGSDAENGGMDNVTYVFSGLGLTNSNSALHLASEGVLLDEVSWTSTTAGSSTSLDPDVVDPNLNDNGNDADPAWCYADAPYGDGDNGSPGFENPMCN